MAGQRRYQARGNNALQLNAVFEERTVRKPKVQDNSIQKRVQAEARPKQAVKQQPKQAQKLKPRQAVQTQPKQKTGLFSSLVIVFCIFGILSFVIARYSIICSKGNDINDIKNKMTEVEKKSDEIKTDMAVNLDLGRIEQRAKELKMNFPKSDKIVYLDLGDENNKTTDQQTAENKGENQVSKGEEKNINVLSETIQAQQ